MTDFVKIYDNTMKNYIACKPESIGTPSGKLIEQIKEIVICSAIAVLKEYEQQKQS